MTSTELRPLSLGELLDRTFTYYRRHFWVFVGIMAIPQVFIVAANLGFTLFVRSTFSTRAPQNPAVIAARLPHLMGGIVASYSLIVLINLLGLAVALGATTFAISEVYLGHHIGVRQAYGKLRGKVLRLLGTVGLIILISIGAYIVAALGGFVVAIIPMVALGHNLGPDVEAKIIIGLLFALIICAAIVLAAILILRYGVAIPALVLEDTRPWQALKRSAVLTKGFLWRVFVIWFLMSLVDFVILLVFQAPFWAAGLLLRVKFLAPPAWLTVPASVAGGVGGAVGGPLLIIALALLYYDTRVRKEGLDLQLMLKALDSKEAAAAPHGDPAPGMPPVIS
ncbi:MAG: hypothetical protein ACRD18_05160 [Terriglobia bacterium]